MLHDLAYKSQRDELKMWSHLFLQVCYTVVAMDPQESISHFDIGFPLYLKIKKQQEKTVDLAGNESGNNKNNSVLTYFGAEIGV